LADVAPTLLEMMGIDQPAEMTGQSLISGRP
jgi:2,3-bisphosphoglycerate-independent phosphoglycerate mutase